MLVIALFRVQLRNEQTQQRIAGCRTRRFDGPLDSGIDYLLAPKVGRRLRENVGDPIAALRVYRLVLDAVHFDHVDSKVTAGSLLGLGEEIERARMEGGDGFIVLLLLDLAHGLGAELLVQLVAGAHVDDADSTRALWMLVKEDWVYERDDEMSEEGREGEVSGVMMGGEGRVG